MFLTPKELELLTSYKRPKRQRIWLRENNIPHLVSAAGFPIVAAREIERRLVNDRDIRVKDRPRLELVK